MDKKTTGIVATVASVLLCGCPGIFLCIFGVAAALGGGTMTLGDTTSPMPASYGFVFLCLSLIFIAIPIAVGVFTLRKKPEDTEAVETPAVESAPPPAPKPVKPKDEEPLPPAS
ncbi:MAG: hypothetical protein Kow002_14040 [Anaerolineales bacterium]